MATVLDGSVVRLNGALGTVAGVAGLDSALAVSETPIAFVAVAVNV